MLEIFEVDGKFFETQVLAEEYKALMEPFEKIDLDIVPHTVYGQYHMREVKRQAQLEKAEQVLNHLRDHEIEALKEYFKSNP